MEYAVVRKSAKMIGSLFLLNRQCPTVKQRMTAVIFDAKLILYNNGKNPKIPKLILDLTDATIIGGIEANCRFCIVDNTAQVKHEFEALDEDERAEWVAELGKCQEQVTDTSGIDVDTYSDTYGDESSIYEEVGSMLIYDVPKTIEAASFATAAENNHDSLTPPPPLPLRSSAKFEISKDTDEADFPPPPAFEDTSSASASKVVVVVPPPPPPPKPLAAPAPPLKMIPPPPPPNSNKIQIFTKSPLKAFKAASCKTSTHNATASNDQFKKKETFDEELKQKLIAKKSNPLAAASFDESLVLKNRKMDEGRVEAELEAILKRRREKLLSNMTGPETSFLMSRKSSFHLRDDDMQRNKTSSFRSLDHHESNSSTKFNTLPHRFKPPAMLVSSTAAAASSSKPRVPEKKPVFVREHSLKLQSWSRMSAGNKCI